MPALNTAPPALDDVENAAQRAFGRGNMVLDQQMIRMSQGDNTIAEASRQDFTTTRQLTTYVGAQALLGSDPTLQAGILAARSVQAQPQTTGQLVSGPPQVVSNAPPVVYSVNPQTGAVTKAS